MKNFLESPAVGGAEASGGGGAGQFPRLDWEKKETNWTKTAEGVI